MMERMNVGIVGGGQLGRMLTQAALPLGRSVTVIDPVENCPAAQVGAYQIGAELTDAAAVRELASKSDVITWEIEHINAKALANASVPVEPSPYTLITIKDKLDQKRMLTRAGIPVADFMDLDSHRFEHDLTNAFEAFGNLVVKRRSGGYDGRGNMVVRPRNRDELVERFGTNQLYAEKLEVFEKELAVIIARDVDGNIAQYPVVETIHEDNICNMVLSPAQIDPRVWADAEEIAHETARHLEGAGIFAIEMFHLAHDGRVVVNEIAPRVHNSGHLTIEANVTSQFEQDIRAVTGLPLGDTEMISPAAVMINILGDRNGPVELSGLEKVLTFPDTHVHLYGKSPTKVARKMGHITVRADTIDEARKTAIQARKALKI